MVRSVCLMLGFLWGLAGCGSTIGQLDSLPSGPDVSGASWPRLVDTPEPPEDRLTSGEGAQALTRLTASRTAIDTRSARARDIAPVSDQLLTRGAAVQSRAAQSAPSFDEADLLARAEVLRARTQETAAPAQSFRAPLRPAPLRPLDAPVVSSAFEERARRARERAAQAGS